MLEFTMIEPGGILRVTPSGALTAEDFIGLNRFADEYLETHEHLAGLLIEAQSFPGWDGFASFAAHLRFIRNHQKRIERIALVTDSSMARVVENLSGPFLAADIRDFRFDQYDAAVHWLRTDHRAAVNLLIVLTSHAELGTTGRKTGFWLEELASPYYVFIDAGATVTLASPLGGQPPIDPNSDAPDAATDSTRRFNADPTAQAALASTRRLRDIVVADFDGVFYPGGHGPLWDLADDPTSIALIQSTLEAGKPLAAVCHGPAVFKNAKSPAREPLVRGRAVTGFSNTEEGAAELTDVVPFLVEDMLIEAGGVYSKAADWQSHVVTDGLLVTGQNPASSASAARALLSLSRATVSPS